MFIGTQYYRPPFPSKKWWDKDLDLMKKTGLDALQLWACWGWIEPEPGVFKFDDYDELIMKAKEHGLKAVISTIAEIHPFWIHRIVPDSHMIDHTGNKVESVLRDECNVGLTPGGCFDNPKVLELMGRFLQTTAQRYANEENIIGWDCWNELRWAVGANGYVCHCPHTVKNFRKWLEIKYGNLEGLNTAWKRRYSSWEDVFPGKTPKSPYTEHMEFMRFLTWRASRHTKFRYDQIRKFDKKNPISAHGGGPSVTSLDTGGEHILCRGNDWDHAEQLDILGCSHFPFSYWEHMDEFSYANRLESIRSAAGKKPMWISELQGGGSRHNDIDVARPVNPESQQSWIWNGLSRGAKGIIFWCWRDEVFGHESSGYGLIGKDGYSKERLYALKLTCDFLEKNRELIDKYRPDPAKAGVFFEPDNYYLNFSDTRNVLKAGLALNGYIYAFEKLHIPYEIVENNHMDNISGLKLLVLPWPYVVSEKACRLICDFVTNGGTLLCEGEMDSFDALGFYRYPGEERKFSASLGIKDKGRRINSFNEIMFAVEGKKFSLSPSDMVTPLEVKGGAVIAKSGEKDVLAIKKKVGKGSVYALGTFLGKPYREHPYRDFEEFLRHIAMNAGALPEIDIEPAIPQIQWRSGLSGDSRLLFVVNSDKNNYKIKIDSKFIKNISADIKGNSCNLFLFKDKFRKIF